MWLCEYFLPIVVRSVLIGAFCFVFYVYYLILFRLVLFCFVSFLSLDALDPVSDSIVRAGLKPRFACVLCVRACGWRGRGGG